MSRSTQIQQVYLGLLGRAADPVGLDYWVNNGLTVAEIANNIVNEQPEFSYDDREVAVRALYENLFGREANDADVAYWVDESEAPTDALLFTFLEAAGPQDAAALSNRTFVANAYTQAAAETGGFDKAGAAAILADVDHTTDSVSEALANIDGSLTFDPTEALDAYLSAQAAVAEFLVDALDNQQVAAIVADPTAETATAADLAAAKTAAENELSAVFNSADSPNVRDAKITDAVQGAQRAIQTDQTELAEAERAFRDGANRDQQAMAAEYEAFNAELDAVKAVRDEAFENAATALATLQAAQQQDVTIEHDLAEQRITATTGSDNPVTIAAFDAFDDGSDGGRVVVTADGLNYAGLQAVVDAINEGLAANDALEPIRVERDEVLANLATEDADVAGLYNDVLVARGELDKSEAALTDLEEAIAAYREITALNAEYGALVDAADDARDVLVEDLELNLEETATNATLDDDLFLFTADGFDGASIANFGARGDDRFYFGDDFELVALGDNEITDRVGAADQLEIFWAQDGTDLVLYVENHPEAGRETIDTNVTTITLTGVSAEGIAFEGGFLTVA